MTRNYIKNLETGKIELHFTKQEFQTLSADLQSNLRSAYLWSPKADAWVSRSINNHWRAIDVAKKLGFTEEEKQGERLTYAEQLERKAEKAEQRAERYSGYADNAKERAENLQAPLNSHRGDTAFFTQPIISGHSGSQAFGRRRDALFARYGKGFEEYKKSEYFQDKMKTALRTANMEQLKDPVYLNNRIKECQANIRRYERALKKYENHEPTPNLVKWQEDMLEKLEYEIDKLGFFQTCLEQLQAQIRNTGGNTYTKDDIKVGYLVKSYKHDLWARIEKVNPKTVYGSYIDPHMRGLQLACAYPEIKEVRIPEGWTDQTEHVAHPIRLGDIMVMYAMGTTRVIWAFQVVKTTDKTITIQPINIVNSLPVPNHFISNEVERKTVKQDRNGHFVVNHRNYYLYKYNA